VPLSPRTARAPSNVSVQLMCTAANDIWQTLAVVSNWKIKAKNRQMNTVTIHLHTEECDTCQQINRGFEILQSGRIWRRESVLQTNGRHCINILPSLSFRLGWLDAEAGTTAQSRCWCPATKAWLTACALMYALVTVYEWRTTLPCRQGRYVVCNWRPCTVYL